MNRKYLCCYTADNINANISPGPSFTLKWTQFTSANSYVLFVPVFYSSVARDGPINVTVMEGSLVSLIDRSLTGIFTRGTVKVRIFKPWLIYFFPKNFRCWSCSEGKIRWNSRYHGDPESWPIWGPGMLLQWSWHQSDEDSLPKKTYIKGGDLIYLESTEYEGCLSADRPYKVKKNLDMDI